MTSTMPIDQFVTKRDLNDLYSRIEIMVGNTVGEIVSDALQVVDERFKQVDKRFAQIDERFEQIDRRFEQIDKRFEHVDKRFDRLEDKLETVTATVGHNSIDIRELQRKTN